MGAWERGSVGVRFRVLCAPVRPRPHAPAPYLPTYLGALVEAGTLGLP